MLKIENTVTPSEEWWEAVVRGVRNPYDSWDKSDSYWLEYTYYIGEKDLALMKKLAKAGDDHGKFMRMLPVICEITGPFYWWKEADTYKVGTVADSCSTMHTITAREFTPDDFSIDDPYTLEATVCNMNMIIQDYKAEEIAPQKKLIWRDIIQTLPSSFNQKRTWMCNYQVLKHIYHARKGHRLEEWETFREWIRTLPYSVLITGEGEEE